MFKVQDLWIIIQNVGSNIYGFPNSSILHLKANLQNARFNVNRFWEERIVVKAGNNN